LIILLHIILQVGWARERWTDPLFTKTFPTLATSGYLAKGCKIWLPNLQCIEESLSDFYGELSPYFIIRRESNPLSNPLYRATEDVEKELLMCPDALTNETQMRPLYDFSQEPFCVLELRSEFVRHPVTPVRATKRAAAEVPISHENKKKRPSAAAVVSDASDSDAHSPVKKSKAHRVKAVTLAM
jgi:hypothetical protein